MDTVVASIPSFEDFAANVNSIFTASADGAEAAKFELIEAKELFSDERTQSFSLLFLTDSDVRAEQGIFSLSNASIGSHDLFLVPIRQTDDGLVFEASFNLVK
ncbi:MAG: hypothetical protein ABL952_17515 [Pyrinomonadaceae bacterium]